MPTTFQRKSLILNTGIYVSEDHPDQGTATVLPSSYDMTIPSNGRAQSVDSTTTHPTKGVAVGGSVFPRTTTTTMMMMNYKESTMSIRHSEDILIFNRLRKTMTTLPSSTGDSTTNDENDMETSWFTSVWKNRPLLQSSRMTLAAASWSYDEKTGWNNTVLDYLNDSSSSQSIFSAKVILIGDANTGKTTLTHRYVDGVFSVNYKTTIGADIATKEYRILNRKFLLHIVDTAGQERFRSISRAYYRNSHVILLSFDLGSMDSFENTKYWFQEATQENHDHPYYVFLVGCKRDTTRVVDVTKALDYANLFRAEYVEISSKTYEGIDDLFERVAGLTFELSVLAAKDGEDSKAKDKRRIHLGKRKFHLNSKCC